jgi:hypothetical protein
MSELLPESTEELIEQAVLGRHKNGPWGYVPFPRHITKAAQVRDKLDPSIVGGSRGYDNLKRHRERCKILEWPVGNHSLIQVEEHFYRVFGRGPKICLIVSQADVYIGAFQHNLNNLSMRLRIGAEAFLKLWKLAQERSQDSCETCFIRSSSRDLKKINS